MSFGSARSTSVLCGCVIGLEAFAEVLGRPMWRGGQQVKMVKRAFLHKHVGHQLMQPQRGTTWRILDM